MSPEEFAQTIVQQLATIGIESSVLESPNDHVISIEHGEQVFFLEVIAG